MGTGVKAKLRLFYPWEREPVPITKEAESAPGPICTREETLAPLGFESRTVQPAASSNTDYAIPVQLDRVIDLYKFENVSIVSRGKTVSDVKCEILPLCSSRSK
jgi:hypothetical protein